MSAIVQIAETVLRLPGAFPRVVVSEERRGEAARIHVHARFLRQDCAWSAAETIQREVEEVGEMKYLDWTGENFGRAKMYFSFQVEEPVEGGARIFYHNPDREITMRRKRKKDYDPVGRPAERPKSSYGRKLHAWLAQKKWTRTRLAEELDCPLQTIENWLHTETRPSRRYERDLDALGFKPGKGKDSA